MRAAQAVRAGPAERRPEAGACAGVRPDLGLGGLVGRREPFPCFRESRERRLDPVCGLERPPGSVCRSAGQRRGPRRLDGGPAPGSCLLLWLILSVTTNWAACGNRSALSPRPAGHEPEGQVVPGSPPPGAPGQGTPPCTPRPPPPAARAPGIIPGVVALPPGRSLPVRPALLLWGHIIGFRPPAPNPGPHLTTLRLILPDPTCKDPSCHGHRSRGRTGGSRLPGVSAPHAPPCSCSPAHPPGLLTPLPGAPCPSPPPACTPMSLPP